jgi:hypothetical protein
VTVATEKPESEKDQNVRIIDDGIKRLKDGDDGAHWEAEILEASRQLYHDDKSLFQRKRSELKKASKEAQITDWTRFLRWLQAGISEDIPQLALPISNVRVLDDQPFSPNLPIISD